jgi:hypothetical protein
LFFVVMLFAFGLAITAMVARSFGLYGWFMAGELVVAAGAYVMMRKSVSGARWDSID